METCRIEREAISSKHLEIRTRWAGDNRQRWLDENEIPMAAGSTRPIEDSWTKNWQVGVGCDDVLPITLTAARKDVVID
jgi:hypothetical protein